MNNPRPPKTKRHWYHPTPDGFLTALLPIVGLLWLSEQFCWFAFNEHKNRTVLIAVAVVGVAVVLLLLWLLRSLLSRRRFQFSLRSLLALVVAVSVVCSWLAVTVQQARRQREVIEKVDEYALYDYHFDPDGRCLRPPAAPAPPGPPWLRNLLGVDFLSDVTYLSCAQATDAELAPLKGLTSLEVLWLNYTQITDAGLKHLDGLTRLKVLGLNYTQVTDAGLEHLDGLTNLEVLWLDKTQVTDAGLEHLKGLRSLQYLYLHNTQVTNEGVSQLQQALPKCRIEH